MSLLESLGKKLEPLMLFMGLVSPIATMPQLYKLFISHPNHAHGLLLTTWLCMRLFLCSGLFMVSTIKTRQFG